MQLLLVQGALGSLDPGPADRVPDRAGQQLAVDLALDQVILGAGGDRLGPAVLVGQAGEDQQRDAVGLRRQPAQAVQPGRVRQPEVEQHAVDAADLGLGLGQGAGAQQLDRADHLVQELLHQERVPVVVLDQQDAQALGRSSRAHDR